MSQRPRSTISKKFTWGRTILFALIAAIALWAAPADAQGGRGNNKPAKASVSKVKKPAKVRHAKLDEALNEVADGVGDSDVIVEFHDDADGLTRIKAAGGKGGRRLGIIRGRAGRMPNALLKKLANDPKVKRIHRDRETSGEVARTAAAVGAASAQKTWGYTGAGIGVAVIDSGITPWHDDLTADRKTGQRVTAFVDFVNGQTVKYDDWGHGTHVAGIIGGNGTNSGRAKGSIAPEANVIALKALDGNGRGRISHIIAALDWAVANRVQYNIRVINMSLGAGVFESYTTDPLTLAAKRAVDVGIVVVASAGNLGQTRTGAPQYGAIAAPGNAPWVLTVGASSSMGTITRRDDTMAEYSSRGPTLIDFALKPDLVAPGSGIVSLSEKNSLFYQTKAAYLKSGSGRDVSPSARPYLTLSGTSMAAPVVSGTVALMLEANPSLTPNMVKAILQYTAEVYPDYNYLTQGAGFVNTLGAVRLSRFFATAHKGDRYPIPTMSGRANGQAWSQHIFWGNRRVSGGVLTPGGTAWDENIVWGAARTPAGQNIVWGENCDTADCGNIVWGNNIVWGASDATDNIVWGNTDADNIVWGNAADDNIVWGNGDSDNIVWGNAADDNIVWGNDCGGADCDNVVWGSTDADNVVWGNAEGLENIVWGNADDGNIVWGNSADDNVVWGNATIELVEFGDDAAEVDAFDATVWEGLFGDPPPAAAEPPAAEEPPAADEPPATEVPPAPEPTTVTTTTSTTDPVTGDVTTVTTTTTTAADGTVTTSVTTTITPAIGGGL